jgi:hypothetical protein
MSQAATNGLQTISEVLEGQDNSEVGVDLCIARKNKKYANDDADSQYKFGRVNIKNQMANRLVGLVSNEVKSTVSDLNDDENELTEAPYNIANKNRDKDLVQYLSFGDIEQSDKFDPLIKENIDEEDSFRTYYDIKFIAIRLHPPEMDTTIVAFQTFSRGQVLKTKEKIVLSRVQRTVSDNEEPVYDAKVKDTLYQFPYRVDAVYNSDSVYVFHQQRFERIFDYYQEFQNAANDVISELEEMDITITGMENIKKACKDFPNAARLFYDVRELGHYRALNQDKLKYLFENYSPDSIIKQGDQYQLNANDRFGVWSVLRVLNDSHLESGVTNERYISLSKQSTGSSTN